MIGLSRVKRTSKSLSEMPWGCSLCGCSVIKFTTLMTRIFSSGKCWRSIFTAASVSSVGTSPQQAMTTSGSPPSSLLAHSQMPSPAVQCLIASSMSSHCSSGCLPATMTLTSLWLRRQWSVTDSRVLASGGKYTRMTSAFLFAT
jgi:hypothetical protein